MHSLLAPSDDLAPHSNPLQLEYFVWSLSRMPSGEMPAFAVSPALQVDSDMALVERVMASFKLAQASFRPSTSPWDTALFDIKKTVYDALSGTNTIEAANVLRDPAASIRQLKCNNGAYFCGAIMGQTRMIHIEFHFALVNGIHR